MTKPNPSKFEPSPEQKAIIESKGDTIVVSNPGTGKTFTLSRKVIDLLENGVEPEDILCITFTEKAKDVFAKCPACNKSSSTREDVDKEFGFRNIDGIIRPQSWCRACRKKQITPKQVVK